MYGCRRSEQHQAAAIVIHRASASLSGRNGWLANSRWRPLASRLPEGLDGCDLANNFAADHWLDRDTCCNCVGM